MADEANLPPVLLMREIVAGKAMLMKCSVLNTLVADSEKTWELAFCEI